MPPEGTRDAPARLEPPAAGALTLRATLHLTACWLALRLFPYRSVARVAHPPLPADAPTGDPVAAARALAGVVQAAARRTPVPTTCLTRSLVLCRLVRRRGIDARTVLGVRKDGQRFTAHAWVEVEDVVVNDTQDVAARYAPIDAPAAAARFA